MPNEFTWGQLVEGVEDAINPVPAGDYDIVITKVAHKTSKSGYPMYAATLKITSGPHLNRLLWNNFTVAHDNPNAMLFFFRSMKNLGLDTSFFQANPTEQQIVQALTGRQAVARISVGSYNGQANNNVDAIFPATGGVTPAGGVGPAPTAGVPTQMAPQPASIPTPGVPVDQPPAQPVAQPQPQPQPQPQVAQPQHVEAAPTTPATAEPQPTTVAGLPVDLSNLPPEVQQQIMATLQAGQNLAAQTAQQEPEAQPAQPVANPQDLGQTPAPTVQPVPGAPF